MIVTELYDGQGLGNQLWCYVVARVIALDHGYDFGIMHPEKWKGASFLSLDFGKPVIGGIGSEGGTPRALPEGIAHYYRERAIDHPLTHADIRTFDPNLVGIADNTKIDGIMQDEEYVRHRKKEIRAWLAIRPERNFTEYAKDDLCVINFRGGEYVRVKEVFLTEKYWTDAVARMKAEVPSMRFVVVTDDVRTARKFFPDFEVRHQSIAEDYAIVANARYLILSNSSFAWFPSWLNENAKLVVAPKYWAHHNVSDGYWTTGGAITDGWTYLDRTGAFFDSATCRKEFESYKRAHAAMFAEPKIGSNFLLVSNFYNDLSWVPEYTDNYLVYDQSAMPILPPTIDADKVITSEHRGHNIRDYCTFIIDNYDSLPERSILCAGNVFPRHVSRSYFNAVMNSTTFMPIFESSRHASQKPIAYVTDDDLYAEYNDSWYLRHHPTKYFKSYDDFLRFCFKDPTVPQYVKFAPGANYVVPRENILRYPKAFYENLRLFVSHTDKAIPGESHIIERALYTLWRESPEASEAMKAGLPAGFAGAPHTPKKRTLGSLSIQTAGLAVKAYGRAKYVAKKLPSLLQYFTGARDRKGLWQRPEIAPLARAAEKARRIVAKAPKVIANKTRTTLNERLSRIGTALDTKAPDAAELSEHRKTIRVYDAFIFFNELDLLEIRLSVLDPYVDFFVIVEATETFSGKPKTLSYEDNKERFKKWEHKIIHSVTRDTPKSEADARIRLQIPGISAIDAQVLRCALTSDNIPKGEMHWFREFYQKESIGKALAASGIRDNDICYISDIDEIWNPLAVVDYRKNVVHKFEQLVYAYYLNMRSSEPWAGTIATKYKNVRGASINHLDTGNHTRYRYVKGGGWHFTNQGGADKIRMKLESYGHQEFNTEDTKAAIEERMLAGVDFIGRKFEFWTDESDLPDYLKNSKEKYSGMFTDKKK